jgi:circadian clock protein KaiB
MGSHAVVAFRLYVAGEAQNSTVAMNNLTALCREHLEGRHEIEVIDVFQHPERALEDGIMMTPTVVRIDQSPMRTVVGNLSESAWVVHALGLAGRIT